MNNSLQQELDELDEHIQSLDALIAVLVLRRQQLTDRFEHLLEEGAPCDSEAAPSAGTPSASLEEGPSYAPAGATWEKPPRWK